MAPTDVDLGSGTDTQTQLVDLHKGLPEAEADPPDIVGDHGLGNAHGVEQVKGGHVLGDDLAPGLPLLAVSSHPLLIIRDPGGQLLEVLRLEDSLEVLPVVLSARPSVGGGLQLALVQELPPPLAAQKLLDNLDNIIARAWKLYVVLIILSNYTCSQSKVKIFTLTLN